jgi:rhodanese-related sulfurtransferase
MLDTIRIQKRKCSSTPSVVIILNYPLHELTAFLSKLEKDKPVIAVCNSAYRSSLAVGVFERNGFNLAASLEGGGEAWVEKGLPMIEASGTVGVTSVKRAVSLPSRLSVEELKRLLMDLPDSVEVVDVRPASYFKDYNIPGSVNVDVSDLLYNSRWRNGKVPLIIVCRDGSISMAIGGALSQESDRQIKVLFGGVEAFWNGSRTLGGTSEHPMSHSSTSTPAGSKISPSGPVSAPVSPTIKTVPEKPKRRSAGC